MQLVFNKLFKNNKPKKVGLKKVELSIEEKMDKYQRMFDFVTEKLEATLFQTDNALREILELYDSDFEGQLKEGIEESGNALNMLEELGLESSVNWSDLNKYYNSMLELEALNMAGIDNIIAKLREVEQEVEKWNKSY